MTVWAYLRVSSLKQDEQNQRRGVDLKAEQLNITIDKYIIDKVSGTKEPDERNLGRLLRRAKSGDVILVSELSRLGRRMYMLFRIVEDLLKKGVRMYSVEDNFCLDDSLQSTVLVFAFGLAAQIERDMISMRTREALQRRKAMGMHLGRPFGYKLQNHKLDSKRARIQHDLAKGVSKSRLARRYDVCVKTMRKYIRLHSLAPA